MSHRRTHASSVEKVNWIQQVIRIITGALIGLVIGALAVRNMAELLTGLPGYMPIGTGLGALIGFLIGFHVGKAKNLISTPDTRIFFQSVSPSFLGLLLGSVAGGAITFMSLYRMIDISFSANLAHTEFGTFFAFPLYFSLIIAVGVATGIIVRGIFGYPQKTNILYAFALMAILVVITIPTAYSISISYM